MRASLNFLVALCGIGLLAFLGTLGELFSLSSASSGFSKDFLLLEPFEAEEDVESGLGPFVAEQGTMLSDSSIDFNMSTSLDYGEDHADWVQTRAK
jgi:hypothetical protein